MGGAFTASVKPLVQHGRASSKYIGEHGRHIYKQMWRPLVGEISTLEREEGNNNHDSLLKHATVLGHATREFCGCFWHFLRHRETITCEVTLKKAW